jgi:Tfp pilus assembly protein PilX
MIRLDRKGIALFMVLATILVVVILCNIVLSIISSQSRLTHHEVSRIRAYYAAQAGLVYTMEKLRNGSWPSSGASDRYYCMALVAGGAGACVDSGVTLNGTIPYDKMVTYDGTFRIQVKVYADNTCSALPNPPAGCVCVEAKADYTYGNP